MRPRAQLVRRPDVVIAMARPILTACAAAAIVLCAPAHAAETELATLPADAPISAYAGRVVFSELRADALWHLRQWTAGAVRDVPVAPQRRPFDVDAGPNAAGAPVAVYSRCATDRSDRVLFSSMPDLSRSTGCAIYEVGLDGGDERRRAVHGSEFLPSIWRGAIAFVRQLPLERTSRVVVRPADGGAFRVAGLTTAPCPTGWCTVGAPRATAEQLDLGARRLALVWRYDGGQVDGAGPGWEASSVALRRGDRPRFGGTGHVSGACGGGQVTGVAATATGFSLMQTRSDCHNYTVLLARMSGDRRAEAVVTDDVQSVAWDRATPYVLRGIHGSRALRLVRLDQPRLVFGKRRPYGGVTGFDGPEKIARRTYRVGGGRETVDARAELRGAARIRVPRAWKHLNRDGSPSQLFSFQQKDCVARTTVSLRASATRATPAQTVRRATRFAVADVARGTRAGGRFAVVELGPGRDRRVLHGIASVRIAPRRIVDVRTFTELRGRCTDGIVLADAIPQALTVLVRTADTHGLRRASAQRP